MKNSNTATIVIPTGWKLDNGQKESSSSETRSFASAFELVPEAIRNIAQPGTSYRNPQTGVVLQKQSNGKWKKTGTEALPVDILKNGVKGRVPKNDPEEPNASGFTPLEKARQKLELFRSRISNPDNTPSDSQMDQYGKLKVNVEELENKRESLGGLRGLFGKKSSDLDSSKTREKGKLIRKIFPDVADRQTLIEARRFHRSHLKLPDPLLRRRSKFSTEEVLNLEKNQQKILRTAQELDQMIKKTNLKNSKNYGLFTELSNYLKTLKSAHKSYSSALSRATKSQPL